MKDLNIDGLRVSVHRTRSDIELQWRGQSVSRSPAKTLGPFFQEVLQNVDGRRLSMDFRHFEFMNSSTVRPIIEFLKAASARADGITVYYRADVTWQRLSFRVVEALAKQWENVTFQS